MICSFPEGGSSSSVPSMVIPPRLHPDRWRLWTNSSGSLMITTQLAWTWSSWRCPIAPKLEQTIGLLSGSELSIQEEGI